MGGVGSFQNVWSRHLSIFQFYEKFNCSFFAYEYYRARPHYLQLFF